MHFANEKFRFHRVHLHWETTKTLETDLHAESVELHALELFRPIIERQREREGQGSDFEWRTSHSDGHLKAAAYIAKSFRPLPLHLNVIWQGKNKTKQAPARGVYLSVGPDHGFAVAQDLQSVLEEC